MNGVNQQLKEIKRQWLIDSILKIRSEKGHNQNNIAQEIGVSNAMISRLKGGKTPVPENIIDKISRRYNIPPPDLNDKINPTTKEGPIDYISENKIADQLTESLINTINDLRRELSEVYDHIGDLKEFNEYLKKQA